ncbi:oligosaccharide flippase family protein [Pseudonocardia endophytica]|uniref:PST family polysaccharide transporter n=1 Tax=Pseudonocardia endophytica TaxID=401976 RepID=A0A4R1HFH2_PSEEN|nr:oligosaccharide flippase family protein [Pseudonocardia endophytica]TCK20894.1 PST family polysaccharide transporter [Pseudonocardia endophytica]
MSESTAAEPAEQGGGLGLTATRGSLWLGLVNLLSKGSQVVVTVVLAGFLTEAELGLVTVAVSLVAVGQVVQSMGVFDVVSRTRRDPEVVAGTLMTISVGIGALLALVAVLARDPIAAALGAPAAAPLVVIAAISLPFTAAGGVQMGLMHRELQFRRRMLPDAGSALVATVVTIVLAALGAGAESLAIGLLIGAVLMPVLGVVVGVRVRPGWNRGAAVETLEWTRVVGPGAVVAVLLVNVDYATVSRTLGPAAVGVYSLAFRIAWAPYLMIALVLGAVSFPVYARLRREGRDLRDAATRFLRAVLVLAGGPYLIAALVADRVVVLDARWAPASAVLVVLCGYGLGFAVQFMLQEVVRAVDRPGAYLVLQIAHLALLLAGLVVLTRYGVVAAAFAQLVAVAVVIPPTLWVLHRSGGLPHIVPVARSVAGIVVAGAVGLGVEWGLSPVDALSDPASVPGLVVHALLLLALYGAVMLLTNRDLVADLRSLRSPEDAG